MNRRSFVTLATALLLSLGALNQVSVASVMLNGTVTGWVPGGAITPFSFALDGTSHSTSNSALGYSLSVSGEDPFITWSFTENSTPGVYDVIFTIPIVGGPYNFLTNTAGVTVSDQQGGTSPTTVSGITVDAQVPTGTSQLTLSPANVTAPAGGLLGSNVSQTFGSVGTTGSFGSPTSMTLELKFTVTDAEKNGVVSFNGSTTLLNIVPEPSTVAMALSGLGVIGVGFVARRKRA